MILPSVLAEVPLAPNQFHDTKVLPLLLKEPLLISSPSENPSESNDKTPSVFV